MYWFSVLAGRISNRHVESAGAGHQHSSRYTSQWQPLSMNALMEYKEHLDTEGVGEYHQGRPKMWKSEVETQHVEVWSELILWMQQFPQGLSLNLCCNLLLDMISSMMMTWELSSFCLAKVFHWFFKMLPREKRITEKCKLCLKFWSDYILHDVIQFRNI